MSLTDAIGWMGTALIVGAYAANSWGHLTSTSRAYLWLNLAGAVCVGVNVTANEAWPALALQITWGLISVVSLVRTLGPAGPD